MNIDEVTGSGSLNTGYTVFYGFSIKAQDGDVEIQFLDGSDGDPVAYVSLGDEESVQQRFATPLILTEGLYVSSSGIIEGTVWWSDYGAVNGSVLYPISDSTRGATAPE